MTPGPGLRHLPAPPKASLFESPFCFCSPHLQAPGLPARKPALFEQCLELLYELAAAPDTGVYRSVLPGLQSSGSGSAPWSRPASLGTLPALYCTVLPLMLGPLLHRLRSTAGAATLDLLRGRYAMLAPLLGTVACAPLPAAAEQLPPSLHQRAWLLQLHALELHAADPALPQHAESLSNLLVALFGDDDALSAPEGAPASRPAGRGSGGYLEGWEGAAFQCVVCCAAGFQERGV